MPLLVGLALFAIQGPADADGTVPPGWGNPRTLGDPGTGAGPSDPARGCDPSWFCGAIRQGGAELGRASRAHAGGMAITSWLATTDGTR